jgi:hypothetical protein
MPNHSSASLVKFYRPEFQARIAMNIIREYLGYPNVGEFVVLISVNKFPLQGLFRHAWMHVRTWSIGRQGGASHQHEVLTRLCGMRIRALRSS